MIKIFAIIMISVALNISEISWIFDVLFLYPSYLVLAICLLVDIKNYIDYKLETKTYSFNTFKRLNKIRNFITK
jgi:hypothetical protein